MRTSIRSGEHRQESGRRASFPAALAFNGTEIAAGLAKYTRGASSKATPFN